MIRYYEDNYIVWWFANDEVKQNNFRYKYFEHFGAAKACQYELKKKGITNCGVCLRNQ